MTRTSPLQRNPVLVNSWKRHTETKGDHEASRISWPFGRRKLGPSTGETVQGLIGSVGGIPTGCECGSGDCQSGISNCYRRACGAAATKERAATDPQAG